MRVKVGVLLSVVMPRLLSTFQAWLLSTNSYRFDVVYEV